MKRHPLLLSLCLIFGAGSFSTVISTLEIRLPPSASRTIAAWFPSAARPAIGHNEGAAADASPGAGLFAAFDGPPYKVGKITTPTTTVPEAEEHIAVDPTQKNNLLGVVMDLSRSEGVLATIKYAFSTNGGQKWDDHFIPIAPNPFLPTQDKNLWVYNTDPAVALDRDGNAYIALLYGWLAKGGKLSNLKEANGLYAATGKFNNLGKGLTADQVVPVVPASLENGKESLEDKEWIAVDNNVGLETSGNVYVAWRHVTQRDMALKKNQILFSRSVDHGKSWSKTPLQLSPVKATTAYTGAQVAIGPKGEVYVLWIEIKLTSPEGERPQALLDFATSADGGKTFSEFVRITDKYFYVTQFDTTLSDSSYRLSALPALAVSANGAIGVVYSIATNKDLAMNPNNMVNFIVSTDGGKKWSLPVVINDVAKGEHFFPALAADENNVFHACWLDTRPRDPTQPPNSKLIDVYATYTKNLGKDFAKNTRVTDKQTDVGDATFIGDYIGISAAGGDAHPVWSNLMKHGDKQTGGLQTTTLTVP